MIGTIIPPKAIGFGVAGGLTQFEDLGEFCEEKHPKLGFVGWARLKEMETGDCRAATGQI